MKKKVKYILLGIILLLGVIVLLYLKLMPHKIPLTLINETTAKLTLTETGEVCAGQMLEIYPVVQGEVMAVYVSEGQNVAAGELICNIDPEPVQEKIKQTKSTIASYQSQMASQNGTIEEEKKLSQILITQGERDLAQARRDLERNRQLYAEGFLAQSELELTQQTVNKYQSELDANRQKLNILSESSLDDGGRSYYQSLIEIENSKLKLLEKELEQTEIKAPYAGIIMTVPVKAMNLTGTSAVAELAVTDQIYIEAYVSTADIGSIKVGDEVELVQKQNDHDISFGGSVSEIGTTADLKISALGLEERKVKVRIIPRFPDKSAAPGIGYEIETIFTLYQQEDQLIVPKTALFKLDGSDHVWLVRGGKLITAPVTTGRELRTEFVIVSGLEPGDYVVTDANDQILKNGLRVSGEISQ